jgi:AcrR family transcriptional regulator
MARVTEAHVKARRDQIVNAAWACFARMGYHQTTMQDIATEAGLSAGAIYRYYPGKEAVLRAINDRSQEMGRTLVEWARSEAQGPLGVLQVIGQAMYSIFNDPSFDAATRVNIEIWPELIRSEELGGRLRQEMAFWRTAVSQLLKEAQDRGEVRAEVNPEAVSTLLICAWEGLRHYRLIDRENFTIERQLQAITVLLSADMNIETDKFAQFLASRGPSLGVPLTMDPAQGPGRPESSGL